MIVTAKVIANYARALASKLAPNPAFSSAIKPATLIYAICLRETGYGQDFRVIPRHEQGFCYGGRYFKGEPNDRYGCLAHCSYGPMQMMYLNGAPGRDPMEYLTNLDIVMTDSVEFLSARILSLRPKTVAEIACLWNHGIFEGIDLALDPYSNGVVENYEKGIPA